MWGATRRFLNTLAVLVLVSVLSGCVPGMPGRGDGSRGTAVDCAGFEFPSAAWTASQRSWRTAGRLTESQTRMRRTAISAALRCETFIGLRQTEVRRLLGETTESLPGELTYTVGDAIGPFGGDFDVVVLFFTDGRVDRVERGDT